MPRAPASEHSHAAKLAHLLDDAFEVPGTSWRFGLDPLLVPIVGDAFDFWYKPNLRTLRLLERELERRKQSGEG